MILTKATQAVSQLVAQTKKPKLILGLSGGPDSVFLFHVLLELQKEGTLAFVAAHLDHGWREESGDDAAFCKELCKTHSIPFLHAKAHNLDCHIKPNGSREDIARKQRQHFFKKLAQEQHADFVVLAHHADDQQETFLWRIMRGCTLTGLCGMKPHEGIYLRPLLPFTKQEILSYLKTNGIAYCHDQTNESDNFLRNRIRKQVVPALRDCDERFDQKFADTLGHLQDAEEFLQKLSQKAYQHVFVENDPHVHRSVATGNTKAFMDLDPTILRRVLIAWLCAENVSFSLSSAYLREIIRFLSSPRGGNHQLNEHWKIVKKHGTFWIEETSCQPKK